MREYELRSLDELGRVVLPRVLREKLDLASGDALEVYLEDRKIVLMPKETRCRLCGATQNTTQVSGHTLCKSCISAIIAV